MYIYTHARAQEDPSVGGASSWSIRQRCGSTPRPRADPARIPHGFRMDYAWIPHGRFLFKDRLLAHVSADA